MTNSLQEITLDQLRKSADQPRFNISAEIKTSIRVAVEDNGGTYPQSMAIVVRPLAVGYEIISGHHRAEAAKELGLTAIWAFVRTLDAKEAFMLAAMSNNQRSLTALEYGRHALVAHEQHGMSVAAYARVIGKSTNIIYQYINAYQVLENFGGAKGHYRSVPHQLLAALAPMEKEQQAQALYQLHQRQTGTAEGLRVIQHLKEGKPLYWAFELASGKEKPDQAASRIGGGPKSVPTGKASNAAQAGASATAAVIQQNEETITALNWTLALFQARAEVFERELGADMVAQLLGRIEARHKEILAEAKGGAVAEQGLAA